ncbi:hypothetical protein [Thermococcus gorgonarius]|uniref:Uncharacterized protein n=1 Tax=Thermococcus gorgonarius TaxID=71997 RepID=A0A2Z2M5B4_THEGO|nr:hypothetical protein [Thermococcus gorgonarius]ASJ00219.1 hypothetical protein A3K92_01345 [Thermococcus gorgonarius]
MKVPERAVEIALKISTESLRDEVLRNLSYIFSRAEKFKLAINAATKIKSQYLKKKALKSISDMLAKVIVQKGTAGVSLSELGLTEDDIEHIKPLPQGIVFKDGKLMPGAELLRMRGEIKTGIVPRFERPKKAPPKPQFKEFGLERKNYLIEYFKLLEDVGDVFSMETLAELTEEPLRSWLLEKAGLIYLEIGNFEKTVEIYQKTKYPGELAVKLAFQTIDKPKEAARYLAKSPRGEERLLFTWELALKGIYDEETYRLALGLEKNDYLFARTLKFLAVELLDESKRRKNERLREFSRRLFLEGVRIQREFEAKALGLF